MSPGSVGALRFLESVDRVLEGDTPLPPREVLALVKLKQAVELYLAEVG